MNCEGKRERHARCVQATLESTLSDSIVQDMSRLDGETRPVYLSANNVLLDGVLATVWQCYCPAAVRVKKLLDGTATTNAPLVTMASVSRVKLPKLSLALVR